MLWAPELLHTSPSSVHQGQATPRDATAQARRTALIISCWDHGCGLLEVPASGLAPFASLQRASIPITLLQEAITSSAAFTQHAHLAGLTLRSLCRCHSAAATIMSHGHVL